MRSEVIGQATVARLLLASRPDIQTEFASLARELLLRHGLTLSPDADPHLTLAACEEFSLGQAHVILPLD